MIQDMLVSIFVALVVDPAMAEIRSDLEAAKAPAAVMAQVSDCVTGAGPALARKAWDDPWWGVETAIGVAAGFTEAETALRAASPACAAAIDAVRPLLQNDV
ncbi:hypothetical protein [Prosthecomicrobium sp. N25]|uniref:hypothetical protein n=1 Tax=Prosthecomicrobium sp. N25 TaxID=3129254 RepID=UPI003078629F